MAAFGARALLAVEAVNSCPKKIPPEYVLIFSWISTRAVGGCQPNLALIPALRVCECVCGRLPADSGVWEISWPVPWNPLSPDGLLGGFNSFPALLPSFFLKYRFPADTRGTSSFFVIYFILSGVSYADVLAASGTWSDLSGCFGGGGLGDLLPSAWWLAKMSRALICLCDTFEFIVERAGSSWECLWVFGKKKKQNWAQRSPVCIVVDSQHPQSAALSNLWWRSRWLIRLLSYKWWQLLTTLTKFKVRL